ncbi:MAG: ribonuclease P protein component [bacterium]
MTASPQFRLAYREGTRISDDVLVVYVRPNGLAVSRLGIAVPGRLGSAVRRNRVKRRVREASRTIAGAVPAGADLVIVPRAAVVDAPFERLQESIRALFNRAAGSL